ncbi:MAG: hypothetical protein JJT89_13770, partial [Nitriliruptoraceae bacterium]|nr:hypothetical protein [Nitriliruptoraceae bacterium]
MRINQNIAAFNAYRNLSTTQNHMGKSLEKLSSGFRINRAADDAAGLVKSEGLRAEIRGTNQAVRNAQDGVSLVQTAEGALNEVHSILQRMRELAVSAANTATSDGSAEQAEVNELLAELDAIAGRTTFAGRTLLDGSLGGGAAVTTPLAVTQTFSSGVGNPGNLSEVAFTFDAPPPGTDFTLRVEHPLIAGGTVDVLITAGRGQVGIGEDLHAALSPALAAQFDAGMNDWVVFTSSASPDAIQVTAFYTATPGAGAQFQVGAGAGDTLEVSVGAASAAALGLGGLSVTSGTALTDLDAAIAQVSGERARLGASQNRLEHTIANLQVASENLSASESRIRDADMAQE